MTLKPSLPPFTGRPLYWRFFILLYLLFGSLSLFGADSPTPLIDSLKSKAFDENLSRPASGKAFFELAKAFRPLNADSAVHYAEMSVRVFGNESPSRNKVDPHLLLANIHYAASRFKEAQPWIDKAENLALSLDNDTLLGRIFYVKGNVLATLDDYETSMKYHREAIKLNEKVGAKGLAARSMINIGREYSILERPEKSKEYYQKGIAVMYEVGDSMNLAIGLQNYSKVLVDMGDSASAIANYEKAANILMRLENNAYAVYPLYNLGNHALAKNKVSEARDWYELAEEIAMENEMKNGQLIALMGMTKVNQRERNFTVARDYIRRAWDMAREFGESVLKIDVLSQWAALEEEAGNYKEALRLDRETRLLQEEVIDLERKKAVDEITIQYEIEKKEGENALLREREERLEARQEWGIVVGTLVVLLFLVLISLLVLSNRRRKTFNRALEGKNEIIEEKNRSLEGRNELLQHSNREKDALMGVVAHDLKAPLTKILAMMDLLEAVKGDEVEFERVKGMITQVVQGGQGLIEELVLMSALEKADMKIELKKTEPWPLLEAGVMGFQAQASAKEITLHLEGSVNGIQGRLHNDYFGRILDNILSNAIKFSPKSRSVWIRLREEGGNAFAIEVQDQGPGIPDTEIKDIFQKFSRLSPRPTAGESSTGLGMSIAKELARKMNGEIEVKSKLGEGTTFTLLFPKA